MDTHSQVTTTAIRAAKSKFWLRRISYPDAHACIGTEVGSFNGRRWWHATGKARMDFEAKEAEIVEQLNTISDKYFETIHFHLYMIGLAEVYAVPTIMFFCEEKEARKQAKDVIIKGGLLTKLPGFRVGHQAHRPGIGRLIQPATEIDWIDSSMPVVSATKVYFNILRPPCASDMPIFVKHNNGIVRQATANIVFDGQQYLYLTVSHIFLEETSSNLSEGEDCDSEYDFGSDTASEFNDEDAIGAAHGFVRGDSLQFLPNSGITETILQTSTHPTTTNSCASMPEQVNMTVEREQSTPRIMKNSGTESVVDDVSASRNLEFLGVLARASVDQDWALIEILDPGILVYLCGKRYIGRNVRAHPYTDNGTNAVAVYTSRGPIDGRILEEPSYLRLPKSISYQMTYLLKVDTPLQWGDCGVGVTDTSSGYFYGHVVATSEDRCHAYIMSACHVFEISGLQKNAAILINANMHRQDSRPERSLTPDAKEYTDEEPLVDIQTVVTESALSRTQVPESRKRYHEEASQAQIPTTASVEQYMEASTSTALELPKDVETLAFPPVLHSIGPLHGIQIPSAVDPSQANTPLIRRARNAKRATPSFVFRIKEIRDSPRSRYFYGQGPVSNEPEASVAVAEGAFNIWWECDGQQIQRLDNALIPGLNHYKTHSMYFSDGEGFSVLRGDATAPKNRNLWASLKFDHKYDEECSSSLTYHHGQSSLHCYRRDQVWVKMLLPDIYHGSNIVETSSQGALDGELPIFLALIAFSMPVTNLELFLPTMFHSGEWQQFNIANGRTHRRGVVAEVYTFSPQAGGSTAEEIRQFEDGHTGRRPEASKEPKAVVSPLNNNPPHTHNTQHSTHTPPRTQSNNTAPPDSSPDTHDLSSASAAAAGPAGTWAAGTASAAAGPAGSPAAGGSWGTELFGSWAATRARRRCGADRGGAEGARNAGRARLSFAMAGRKLGGARAMKRGDQKISRGEQDRDTSAKREQSR
ncbi:hypothetical protein OPT61_g8870 [Boeremia exigua]|uniref:Uncharacterized protein n=1 Tax=Boeremia exigua TaxID=749465 RepID=A0ACC2HWG6_9PLEO|nr:hypothetical protein OPT61_g8870 [Boeremia exigua]